MIIDNLGYIRQTREEMEVVFTFLADQLVHHSIIIELNIPSYRLEQAKSNIESLENTHKEDLTKTQDEPRQPSPRPTE